MAITNYGTLKTEIADFLDRTDLTSIIPSFITSAHNKLNRDLRVREMISRATATLDTEYSAFPADFLQVRDIRINTDPVQTLSMITPEQQNQERQTHGNSSGRPKYFTIMGSTWQVFPTPDTNTYTAEMAYYAKIPVLSSDSDTNWLLTKAPEVYLYGALVHAEPYLKNDEKVLIWQTFYKDAYQSLEREDEKVKYSGSTPRVKIRSFG